MTRTEPGTVRDEVDRLARGMVEKGQASNLTEARPLVWKARPDLVATSRSAERASAEPATVTITDQVRKVIDEATRCRDENSALVVPDLVDERRAAGPAGD